MSKGEGCPWKRKNLSEYGIVTQCIAPTRVNDQYLTSVLLKINAKPPRYDEKENAERVAALGISIGLVWTVFGGEFQFVEATSMVEKGDLHLTGQLGDVIKESAQIALAWTGCTQPL